MHTSWIDALIYDTITKWQKSMAVLYFLKFSKVLILTGSRFFGTNHDSSDYDFFMNAKDYSFEFARKLVDLGFERTYDSGYDSDPSVLWIYSYHGTIDIHIQVIKDYWFDRKVSAQDKIKDMYETIPDLMENASKSRMKMLWRQLMSQE